MHSLNRKIWIIAFLCIIFTFSRSEAQLYHKVQIDLSGKPISQLAELGIALQLGEYKPGVFITGQYSEQELARITEAGFAYEVLIEDMSSYYQQRNQGLDRDDLNRQMRTHSRNQTPYPTPENFMLGSMGGFHTYDELLDDLDAMHALFPDLISAKQPIGLNLTVEGRPVYWVRISNNPQETQDKPRVLYTALTHAREPASMQQMLFQMWYILENYASDPEIQYLVNNMEMYFVPCVNPDGYIYCETTHPNGGSYHRKNMRQNSDGSIGVDLNRNFGYMWGHDNTGSSPNPSAQTYRGTAPFSEPETQMQKEFAETYNFILALNNHTYSDLLIYPWGYNDQLTPDGDIFIEYAKKMTRENNYVYGTCYETLSYYANGVSDDWFYGEQETKDKTFAFTPEAGKPSDGFWPAMDRIEEICAGHTHMNLSLARLALPYAEIRDISGPYIAQRNTQANFELINLGQTGDGSFTISLTPITPNIIEVGEDVLVSNMEILETQTITLEMELTPYMPTGDEIQFVVSVDNGQFAWNDTITKYYGQPQQVFFDPCDNLDHWESNTWGISHTVYHSAPGSIADSPGTSYPNNAHTHITSAQAFDFSDVSLAWVEFYTRYLIETNWDYVQFMYSVDQKETWIPLAGNYTHIGGSNQDTGQPLYHGSQTNWVKEEVDLSHLAGEEEVWFRFRLVSDAIINDEGFYFDDFAIYTLEYDPAHYFFPPEHISFYQHQDTILDLADFVSWHLEGDIDISWEHNQNIAIEKLEQTRIWIQNAHDQWTGSEVITLSIADDHTSLTQDMEVTSKPVPAPQIIGQQDISITQGEQLEFQPEFIEVEDTFFEYPQEFSFQIYPGDHYTLQDYIIIPDADFSGMLATGVSVNNGFAQSDVFVLEILVELESSVSFDTAQSTRIFYNTVTGILSVRFRETETHKTQTLTISDLSGRILYQDRVTGNTFKKNLSFLQSGVYIISIQGDEILNQKILIH